MKLKRNAARVSVEKKKEVGCHWPLPWCIIVKVEVIYANNAKEETIKESRGRDGVVKRFKRGKLRD